MLITHPPGAGARDAGQGHGMLRTLFVLACIIKSVSAIPFEDIDEVNFRFTEFNDTVDGEYKPTTTVNYTNGTIFLGFLSNVRGVVMGTDGEDGLEYGWYTLLLCAKAAVAAFLNKSVVVGGAPSTIYPVDYHVLFADESSYGTDKRYTSAAYAIGMGHAMIRGSNLAGQTLPPIRTIIGAFQYSHEIATLSSALKTPMLGYYLSRPMVKANFPYFVRTMPSKTYLILATLASYLNYTRADELGCEFAGHADTTTQIQAQFKEFGISVFSVNFPVSDHTGWPPGYPPAVEPFSEIHFAFEMKAAWDFNFKQLRLNNAHLHILWMGGECPVFDIASYAGLMGLIGKGHLWMVSNYYQIFNGQYLQVQRQVGPMQNGMVSPYAFVKPYDGSISIMEKQTPVKGDMHIWLEWLDDHGYRTKLVPEQWLQEHLTSAVFQGDGHKQWRGGLIGTYHVFDCIYGALLAINEALLTHGTSFTNDQVMEKLMKVEFDGVTGNVKFNEVGDRIIEQQLIQYRVSYRGNDTYTYLPTGGRRLLTEDNYQPLKEWQGAQEGAAKRRRLQATCAPPATNAPADMAKYTECITSVCEDADPAVVSAISGGLAPNCATAHGAVAAQGVADPCSFDLKALIATLPAGSYLWKTCPGTCSNLCADQRCYPTEVDTCAPAGTTAGALMPYFGCLASLPMDSSDALLNTMTGGQIPNCAGLHSMVPGGDCDFDLNALSALLPAGTPLKAVCPGTCAAPAPCQVPADTQPASLAAYFTCLKASCENAADSLVSTLSGGQITSCAFAKSFVESSGGDCTYDLSASLPSLPAGSFLWQLCGTACAETCVAEKDKCAVPSPPSGAPLLTYFACVQDKCADADPTLVSALSGTQIPNCEAAAAYVGGQGGSCTTDLSTLISTLPAGFLLWQLCGVQCKTECDASKAKCAAPSVPTAQFLVPYFSCLIGDCEDATDSLISTLTGTQIPNCAAAYSYVVGQGGDCKLELNTLSPGFPAGIKLWQVCAKTCKSECMANPGPNRTLDFYMSCRKTYCADSPSSVISNLTGGNVADCAALKKDVAKDDCSYDVAQFMPRLGVATPLWSMCSASCNCMDESALGPAPPPPPPPTCPEDPAGCDFYKKGDVVVVGKYVESLEMTGQLKFFDQSTVLPPDLNLPCQFGQRYDVQLGECLDCPAGKFTDQYGETACSMCDRGMANPVDGAGACTPCAWGTFSADLGSTACQNCVAGTYTGEPLQSECRTCGAGTFSDDGAYLCEFCPIGRYQESVGQSECDRCDDLIPGSISGQASSSNASCQCRSGEYLQPSVGCFHCVKGLVCNGGNDIPTQVKGFHAHILNDNTRSYEVYECAIPEWCPDGAPGTCSKNRDGPSCARIFGKGCPWYILFIIPLLGLLAAYIAYRVTSHTQTRAVSQVMILSGNISIAFVAMQAVNVYMSFFDTLPEDLEWVASFTQFFMMQFNMVIPQCNIGQSFLARYAMGILPPLVVVGAFMFLYVLSNTLGRILPSFAPFSLDATINVIGMILQVLYVMQCKDAFAFFNSMDNPSGQETLKAYTDVILWSDNHISFGSILVAVYLFTFYVVGTYCLFVWVVMNAKKKVKDRRFVARFRFVFSRWRPECWHWGLWLLLRNFAIAITPIVARTHMAFQAVLYVVFLMTHALAEARYMPWAAMMNTYFEILISLILSLMATGGLIFDEDKNATPEESAMGILMAALFCCIWAIFILAIVLTIRWGSRSVRKKKTERRFVIGCDLVSSCSQTADKLSKGQAGVQKAWKRFIEHSGDYDKIVLSAALTYLSKFTDPDPLRRASFISAVTSFAEGNLDFGDSERSDKATKEGEKTMENQMEMIKRSSSLSSHASNSILEELGLERHGRLKVGDNEGAEKRAAEKEGEIQREDSDETVNL